jgi:large subunit ribosomal protein L30
MAQNNKILVRQTRSICDTLEKHKRTIKALGLGRPNYVAIHDDTPAIRGMIRTVEHLVTVEPAK